MTEFAQRTVTGIMIGTLLFCIYFFMPAVIFSGLLVLLLMLILVSEMPRLLDYKKPWSWLFTAVYPMLPFCLLIALNQSAVYHRLIFFIFGITFIHDVGAYCVGKLLGKHRIARFISPKKTWEGFLGGLLSVFVVMECFLLIYYCSYSVLFLVFLSYGIAVCATVGDFFESWLKRRAKIKDSGSLLPGHGGLLDRFDSIMAVTVFVYLLRDYFISLLCRA